MLLPTFCYTYFNPLNSSFKPKIKTTDQVTITHIIFIKHLYIPYNLNGFGKLVLIEIPLSNLESISGCKESIKMRKPEIQL